MTLLVTGGTGFVGKHVCRSLGGKALAECDIRDQDAIDRELERIRPDTVIHLAAQAFVPESFKNPRTTFDVNFGGTYNLLRALKNINFSGRLLYVSSGDVYGLVAEEELPVSERQAPRARSPYAVSKIAAEALCYQWGQTEQFDIVIARPFNHIGPGQSERFAISDFARQIVEIETGKRRTGELRVGDIEITRDFLDVRDVVSAYGALLRHGNSGEIYNVCSGRERTLHALVKKMLELSGISATICREEDRVRLSEQRRMVGNSEKICSQTHWTPEIPFEVTLGDLLNYWRAKLSE